MAFKTIIEPIRIKTVEPLKMSTVAERKKFLKAAPAGVPTKEGWQGAQVFPHQKAAVAAFFHFTKIVLLTMCCCYILHSIALNRYYIGHTCEDVHVRLRKHLYEHDGFTGKASDWKIVYTEWFVDKYATHRQEREMIS